MRIFVGNRENLFCQKFLSNLLRRNKMAVNGKARAGSVITQAGNQRLNDDRLFCQKYWDYILQKNKKNISKIDKVSTSFDLTDVNNYLLDCCQESYLPKLERSLGMPINKFIAKSDMEFKFLKPAKTNYTVWRGIGKPEYWAGDFPQALFKKTVEAKKGDIVFMPEYAYSSLDREFSEYYLRRNGGILYQIEVPKGAKLSGDWKGNTHVFPRYSKFECIETEDIRDGKLIKLRYIMRG